MDIDLAMKNINEVKRYFVDILVRVAQVIFTLLIVTPFIADIFSWTRVISGILVFIVVVAVGAMISSTIKEV